MNYKKLSALSGVCCGLLAGSLTLVSASESKDDMPAAEALQALLAGNQRFVSDKAEHGHQSTERRQLVAKGQHPIAVVFGCADSRVPAEIVFDQGLGDLFTVRTAGEVADDAALGSMEYAVEHLGTHLIVVLGHSRCGAVDAATKSGHAPGHVDALVKAIEPAVVRAKTESGNLLANAVAANVQRVVVQLRTSHPILEHLVTEGKVRVVGAVYDLDSGAVTLVPVDENTVAYWRHHHG